MAATKKPYLYILPALLGLMLTLCIRAANDLPTGTAYAYWHNNSGLFLLIELLSVLLYAYPAMWMLYRWYGLCRQHGWSWAVEYGVVIVTTPLSCLFVMWISRVLQNRDFNPGDIPIPLVVSLLFVAFFYAFFRHQTQRLQTEQLKNERLDTELKYLRAQYHPHFLFNVLNTVYFQIDERNEEPRRTLEKLSALLRYQLYNDGDMVDINTEIEHLRQYINLWRLRCSERLKLSVHIDEALNGQMVYPLLFVPLVENAFKYVGGDYQINIDLRLTESGTTRFRIENSVPAHLPPLSNSSHGIGIENLRRRLTLLYPGRHSFKASTENGLYMAELTIALTKTNKKDNEKDNLCDNRR